MYIVDALFLIKVKIAKLQGSSWDEAEIAIEPLKWYIGTGRSSASFERAISVATQRQMTEIAKSLYKHRRGDYSEIVQNIKRYLCVE